MGSCYILEPRFSRKKGWKCFGIVLEEIVRTGDEWEKVLIGRLVAKGVASTSKGAKAMSEEIDGKDEKLKEDARRWARKLQRLQIRRRRGR